MHWPCHNSGMMLLLERIFSKSGACLQPRMANQPTRGPHSISSLPHHWLWSRLRNLYNFSTDFNNRIVFMPKVIFFCFHWRLTFKRIVVTFYVDSKQLILSNKFWVKSGYFIRQLSNQSFSSLIMGKKDVGTTYVHECKKVMLTWVC